MNVRDVTTFDDLHLLLLDCPVVHRYLQVSVAVVLHVQLLGVLLAREGRASQLVAVCIQ